jgi:hypothetical protein
MMFCRAIILYWLNCITDTSRATEGRILVSFFVDGRLDSLAAVVCVGWCQFCESSSVPSSPSFLSSGSVIF